ncbi:FecR domain-containing protein [Roseomonas hellenica]|uniref:FecR domain-containing protein n=1 Tax=Plastoroseomonas hellenica TaxID=2687306 RepID=A0ABS5F611_9PROT|nr:FecR domain-containing protein [Plastoroseomonas hellenica]
MPLYRRAVMSCIALAAPLRRGLAERARVGEVAAVTGEAMARFATDPPRLLAPAAPLLLEDLLTTGAGARLHCQLEGGLEIRLGERASLRVDALTLRGPRAGIALRVFDGPVLLDRPPQAGSAPIEVTLPWARIGVRGTRFFAGPLDDRFVVFVARGRVLVDAAGQSVQITEGFGVDIPAPGAPPDPVRRWGQPRIRRVLALV